jgi:hypothetical protein
VKRGGLRIDAQDFTREAMSYVIKAQGI